MLHPNSFLCIVPPAAVCRPPARRPSVTGYWPPVTGFCSMDAEQPSAKREETGATEQQERWNKDAWMVGHGCFLGEERGEKEVAGRKKGGFVRGMCASE